MARITIPYRLNALLGSSALSHAVRLYIEQFEQWVGDDTKGLYFFPEYTDHGPRHISQVLAGAEALIREDSWPLLSAEDAAVLILAALVHDSAMHLTADGFLALLSAEHASKFPPISLIDSKSWSQLFDDFFGEARRWDQRKLYQILGDQAKLVEEETDLIKTIQHPLKMSNPETWTVRYRKFLGEFVRRHHARLAHEIMLYGLPGSTKAILKPPRELEPLADLGGIVARSHNMHLRATFHYLESKYYRLRTCRKAHPIFLMILLRIADYLEIQPDRVNPTLLSIQRLRSPISQGEIDSHLDIEEVTTHESDSEAIFVIARPRSIHSFLKIRRLLQGLQAELDTSWAVLGEVFSRDEVLWKLGLSLRRVRSSLDDTEQFVEREKLVYFPIQAAFNSTGADLLKLLLEPLYGFRPDIGIRELLQNSLDAVREVWQYNSDHAGMSREARPDPGFEADILITIDKDHEGRDWLTVSDKGIGMTAAVIRDYFLTAGASLRHSDAWKRRFESDGFSKVLRSGRFGIGALAAFLLGDRLEVTTRYIEAKPSEGVQFSASLDDSEIQLNRLRKEGAGTDIRVRLNPESSRYLEEGKRDRFMFQSSIGSKIWDWYTFEKPRVRRMAFGVELNQRYRLPDGREEQLPSDWKETPGMRDFAMLWSYSEAPELSCNGIIVRESKEWFNEPIVVLDKFIAAPKISIIDPNGNLPLTLQREDLIVFPASAKRGLLVDIVRDLYAFLLEYLPRNPVDAERIVNSLPHMAGKNCIWLTARGGVLAHPEVRVAAGIRKTLVIMTDYTNIFVDPEEYGLDACCTIMANVSPYDLDSTVREWYSRLKKLGVRSSTMVVSKDVARKLRGYLGSSITGEWVSLDDYAEVNTLIQLSKVMEKAQQGRRVVIMGFALCDMETELHEGYLMEMIESFAGSPVIPLDPRERLEKLSEAFDCLKSELQRWRRSDLVGWRYALIERVKNFDGIIFGA